jgi:Tol biopolymer transport system component
MTESIGRGSTAMFSLMTFVVASGASLLFSQQPPTAIKRSVISVFELRDRSTKTIYTGDGVIEAPNWSPDGRNLLVNTRGELYLLPLGAGTAARLEKLDTAPVTRCNNDKGFSPDGKLLAFSARGTAAGSQVYIMPASGGAPHLIVSETPSYFHGFSPDGRWMAIVSQRSGNFDLFRVPTSGGVQQRLTSNGGYDDGPDYSPDGRWIYFNSNRSGSWNIWRMPADGAGMNDGKAHQVTNDELEDWFPHCSPDGKWLVFLSFPKGTAGHNDHIEVQLRMIPLPGKRLKQTTPRELTRFFGGQGTINVNSWAPDSSKFAFVRYEQ